MSRFFSIHPENPQLRLIRRAAGIILNGGVIVFPTDSMYALGCNIGDKLAKERIQKLRNLDEKHEFTLLCPNLSSVATYAKVDNIAYRILRQLTPGPYTFVLPATNEVPKRLIHPKRKTIGLRVPSNQIAQKLLLELQKPLMSVTFSMSDQEDPITLTHPDFFKERLGNRVDVILDGGYCGVEPTTVIELLGPVPRIIRKGKGDITLFER